MSSFSYSIKMAFLLFPVVALFFTLPYILWQYHKYGSVNSYRSLIIYSLLLYLMSAYFLVILPLPSVEVVSKMTKPRYNLQPFHLVSEIMNKTNFHVSDFATYFPTMKNPVVYEAIFNMILTLPFGVYLHYYFKCNFKQTFFYSFCFALFFELTQLSGLYFIYPRSYRVFDVDDLILNTSGGVIGYFVGTLFLKFLPSRDAIDKVSLQKGSKVSILKRCVSFLLDLFLFGLFFLASIYLMNYYKLLTKVLFIFLYFCLSFLYFVVIPCLLHGKTLGMKFLKLKFSSLKTKICWYHYFLYYFLLVFEYILLPILLLFLCFHLYKYYGMPKDVYEYCSIISIAVAFIIYIVSLLKRIFQMNLSFEKVSSLKIESTIGIKRG